MSSAPHQSGDQPLFDCMKMASKCEAGMDRGPIAVVVPTRFKHQRRRAIRADVRGGRGSDTSWSVLPWRSFDSMTHPQTLSFMWEIQIWNPRYIIVSASARMNSGMPVDSRMAKLPQSVRCWNKLAHPLRRPTEYRHLARSARQRRTDGGKVRQLRASASQHDYRVAGLKP
jgi:hypothetical protein